MISLTPDEERLRRHLIFIAAAASPDHPEASVVSYEQVAEALDPDGSIGWNQPRRYTRLIRGLYHVLKYEAEHGRPLVTAFVGRKTGTAKGIPGDGFFEAAREVKRLTSDSPQDEYAFWKDELAALVKLWSAPNGKAANQTGLSDSHYDAIMGELSTIKKMLRQILHS
jgi:hypothetical protein